MPNFESTAEVDVDVCEFLEACSDWDRAEALKQLLEEAPGCDRLEKALKKGLSENFSGITLGGPALGDRNMSYDQDEFMKSLNKLNGAYYQLSSEDIEIINKMAKRF